MVKIRLHYTLVISLLLNNLILFAKETPTAKSSTVPCEMPEFNPNDYILPKTMTVINSKGDISYGPIKLNFVRPPIGEKITTTYEKDKNKTNPAPYTFQWLDEKKLILNSHKKYDPIIYGQAFLIPNDGFLNLELSDLTKIELSKDTFFELKKFAGDKEDRIILIRLLKGSMKIQIKENVKDINQISIETPNAIIHHRGSKYTTKEKGNVFIVKVENDSENITTTQLFTEHGQQSVDVFKTTQDGTLYSNTIVQSPLNYLILKGRYGTATQEVTQKTFLKGDTAELNKIKDLLK